jgi:hypothetical protein
MIDARKRQEHALTKLGAMSDRQLEALPTSTLDRVAFGFTTGDKITVPIDSVTIVHKSDFENALHELRHSPTRWDPHIDKPVKFSFRGGKLRLEDGHHRYLLRRARGKKTITGIVEHIEDNPIPAIRMLTRTTGLARGTKRPRRRGRTSGNASAPLVLWHGSQRWEGPPRIVTSRKGQVEHGPGLYLTTSADTARKYAKGGGSVMRFEVAPLRWLGDAWLPADTMVRFLRSLDRVKNRTKIEADIRAVEERLRSRRNGSVPAAILVNLMYNHGALSGDKGPALAEFYTRHGIDADHVTKGNEDWVVLFNLDKILSHRKVCAGDACDSPRIVRLATEA